jgi:2-oxo-3-hexenedioate decarboxylase
MSDRAGWKIGLNVPAVQEVLGIDRSVSVPLTEATRLADGDSVSIGSFTAALVEPEVAVEIGPDGGIGRVGPAIEVVDIDLPFDDVDAIVAGGVFHRGFLIGPLTDVVPGRVSATVTVDGEERALAELDPGLEEAVATVAFRAEERGEKLLPGEVVIAGSLTPPQPIAPGEELTVEVAPLGRLSLTFTD